MTTLDRSFIKAFTEPTGDARPPAARSDAPSGLRPKLSLPGSSLSPSDRQAHLANQAQSSAAPARPLSSFTPPPKIHDASRALLEVDRLLWPPACDELLARATRDWEQFYSELVARLSEGQKCLALASIERGDGRTTVTLALSKHLVARGLRVVTVDGDVENPSLVRGCGISVQTGWDDLVASELALGEALIAAAEDGVTLMPWRGGPAKLADLAASPRTERIFATLREQYDLVLVDLLPLGAKASLDDLAALARAMHLDALYLVQNMRDTSREQVSAMCARLRRADLPLAGIIENFVSRSATDDHLQARRALAVHG
jgi:Mrp family chromosome partitioning ATPase